MLYKKRHKPLSAVDIVVDILTEHQKRPAFLYCRGMSLSQGDHFYWIGVTSSWKNQDRKYCQTWEEQGSQLNTGSRDQVSLKPANGKLIFWKDTALLVLRDRSSCTMCILTHAMVKFSSSSSVQNSLTDSNAPMGWTSAEPVRSRDNWVCTCSVRH